MPRGPTVSLTPRHQTSTSQPQTRTLPWRAWRVTSTLTRPDVPVSGVSTSGQSRWPSTVSPWLHPGLTQHWMSSRSGALAWSSAAMARTRGATVAGGTPRARAIALGVLPRARSARTRLVNSSLSMPGSSHLPVPAGHARAGRGARGGQRGGGDVGWQGWPDLLPRHSASEIRRPVPTTTRTTADADDAATPDPQERAGCVRALLHRPDLRDLPGAGGRVPRPARRAHGHWDADRCGPGGAPPS